MFGITSVSCDIFQSIMAVIVSASDGVVSTDHYVRALIDETLISIKVNDYMI